MTQEQQEKLRRALYNAKFTTDAEDENPFVGIYFNDLLAIIEEYVEPPIYHEGWLAGEANLAKEYKNIQWTNWIPVEERLPPIAYHDDLSENHLVVDSDGELLIAYYDAKNKLWFSVDSNPKIYDVTHWMEIVPPRKEEDNE